MTPDQIMTIIDAKDLAAHNAEMERLRARVQELEQLSRACATIENDLRMDASNEWLHLTIRCIPHAAGYMMWGGGEIKAEAERNTLADMLITIANQLEAQS